MGNAWLEIVEAGKPPRRVGLSPGRLRIGGDGADVVLLGSIAGELHFWGEPARVVFVGEGTSPDVDGMLRGEAPLRPGTSIQWRGFQMVYCTDSKDDSSGAFLEELPMPSVAAEAHPATDSPGGLGSSDERRILRRIQAGLLMDLGIADRGVSKRWQEAVIQRSFLPDACADELLVKSLARADDERMLERSAGLLRDFLMAPLTQGVRGTGRRARHAARGGLAFIVTQGVALLVYSLIVAAILVTLRLRGASLDAFLDQILFR